MCVFFFLLKKHISVCVFILKHVLKDVFLVWFCWCWDNNKRTFCTIQIGLCKISVCQHNQTKDIFFNTFFRKKTCFLREKLTNVFFNTWLLFAFDCIFNFLNPHLSREESRLTNL